MKTRGPSRSNHGRRAGAGLIVDSEASLRWLKATPDLALQELSERLDEVHEVIAPTSTINDWFRARKISFKKTAHASEQERADGQAARVVWRQRQAWLLAHPERVGRTACLDETSINTKMARMRGAVPEASGWLPPLPMVIGKRLCPTFRHHVKRGAFLTIGGASAKTLRRQSCFADRLNGLYEIVDNDQTNMLQRPFRQEWVPI